MGCRQSKNDSTQANRSKSMSDKEKELSGGVEEEKKEADCPPKTGLVDRKKEEQSQQPNTEK